MNHSNHLFLLQLLCLIIFSSPPAQANRDTANWNAVSDASLASLRAGFVLNNGLVVDIQLSKRLFINAEQVSDTLFFSSSDSGDLLISDTSLSGFLQNTMDNQVLSSITQLDIAVSNLAPVQQHLSQELFYETLFFTPPQF